MRQGVLRRSVWLAQPVKGFECLTGLVAGEGNYYICIHPAAGAKIPLLYESESCYQEGKVL